MHAYALTHTQTHNSHAQACTWTYRTCAQHTPIQLYYITMRTRTFQKYIIYLFEQKYLKELLQLLLCAVYYLQREESLKRSKKFYKTQMFVWKYQGTFPTHRKKSRSMWQTNWTIGTFRQGTNANSVSCRSLSIVSFQWWNTCCLWTKHGEYHSYIAQDKKRWL